MTSRRSSGGPARSVRELLRGPGSPLLEMSRHAELLEGLNKLLDDYLDRPIVEHVRVASARHQRLVLCADSPTWGHRIRYLAPTILDHIRKFGAVELGNVHVIVRPALARHRTRGRKSLKLSSRSASLLNRVAADLDNPALARTLRRIGRRARSG